MDLRAALRSAEGELFRRRLAQRMRARLQETPQEQAARWRREQQEAAERLGDEFMRRGEL